MKIFFAGSVCSNDIFNDMVAQSRVKRLSSAQNFTYALMKEISAHSDVDVTIASVDAIASYPNGNRLILKKRQDILTERATAQIVPALNLPGIKQWNHAHGIVKLCKKWLRENRHESDKCVLVFGVSPLRDKKLLKICKQHGCGIYALITDVPSTMFTYTNSKSLVWRLFAGSYREAAIAVQGRFDGYIYLTRAMQEEVAPEKPSIVVEALVDSTIFDHLSGVQKAAPPALMYAGALYKKYGVDVIVESFEQVKTPCELWLFGTGDYEEEIQRKVQVNPRIRYFGCLPREEVLRREKEATLLLNLRNAEDAYTKYSFPSKMVEYMLSGTPLLTTKLPGVPDDYDSHCYTLTERSVQTIAATIDHLLQHENLPVKGAKARAYILEYKNSTIQVGKILRFLKEQVRQRLDAA